MEESIREALKSIEKFGFHLEKTDTNITRIAIKPIQRKKQKVRPPFLHQRNSVIFEGQKCSGLYSKSRGFQQCHNESRDAGER